MEGYMEGKRSRLTTVLVLLAVVMCATLAVGQDSTGTGVPGPSALEKFGAFLYNPLTLMVASAAIMFVPGVRAKISNYVIPFITTFIAWIGGLISPSGAKLGAWLLPNDPTSSTHALLTALGGLTPAANAGDGSVAVIGLFGIGLGGFFGGIGGAVLQAAQAYLLQRMFAWPGKVLPKLPEDSAGQPLPGRVA